MVTPDAKRKAVAHACTVHAVSQRRACLALTIDRSTVRYTSTRPGDALLREAMKAANQHLDYIDYLIDHRTWLAGATMSLADLAAAAHISVADYLGGIDWTGHEQTKGWYSGLKSRPSFRPLLAERMEIVTPPKYYEDVDF